MIKGILAAGLMLTVSTTSALAATEVTWWHAMGGTLGEKVEEIAANFNAMQDEYVIVPTYKGGYTDTMNAAIAAFRAGEQPDIVQVFEVGTGTMMAAKGAIYPVYQLMAETGADFDPSAYLLCRFRLLHRHRRPHAFDALQFLDPDPLLQQGRVRSCRPRPPTRPQRPGKRLKLSPTRSWNRVRPPAASPPAGFPGFSSKTCRPGTTSRSARSRTASAVSARN